MMRRLVSGVTYLLGGFFVRNVANEFERSWRYVCASLDIATNEPNPTALSQSESDAQSSEPNPIVNIEQRQPVPIYHVVHLLLRRFEHKTKQTSRREDVSLNRCTQSIVATGDIQFIWSYQRLFNGLDRLLSFRSCQHENASRWFESHCCPRY